MLLFLEKHEIIPIKDLVEKRLEVLKNRVLKQHGEDWYDYDNEGILSKIREKSNEFFRLENGLEELNKALKADNDSQIKFSRTKK